MVAPRTQMNPGESCIGLPIDETCCSSSSSPETERHSHNNKGHDNNNDNNIPFIDNNVRKSLHHDDDDDHHHRDATRYPQQTITATTTSLEDRVVELEEKLATLSRLLQQQRRSVSPPPITPPASPPPDEFLHPALDSPAPAMRRHMTTSSRRKRNLSFRVLHDDSPPRLEEAVARAAAIEASPESIYIPDNVDDDQIRLPPHPLSRVRAEEPQPMPTTGDPPNKPAEQPEKKKDIIKSKWLDYLNSFQESNYDTDKQMEEFVKVPSAVESLLSFGFWICVDSFLYIVTILPIRFVWSLLLLIRFCLIRLFRREVPDGPFRFHRRHSYQLIQVGIISIIYKYCLMPISIGKFYHWVRGQAMIKLYVVIAMVEVFDRLMCSMGQDCLDSLYWNTTRRPRSSRLVVSIAVTFIYTMIHSLLLFVHVATMNVAMNSEDHALISLLIGGNFAEIKSTVFKKYNKANLFKITAGDICERFKLALFLALVLTLNLAQGMDEKMVMNYVSMCGVVWCAEWLSDWVKHAFITKFNYISSGIYPEYGLLLAGDVTGIGHEGVNLDHSHAVVKRIGFAQLPLVCVMARYLKEGFKYATYGKEPPTWKICAGIFSIWLALLLCKLALGSFLHRISLAKLRSAPEFSAKNAKLEAKKKKE